MEYHKFISDNLNKLTFDICKDIINNGNRIPSRNGMTYEHCDVGVYLTDPRNRHLYLEGRKSNIFACLGEIFWVMSGTNELNPLMTTLLPRSTQFSDNGTTWQNGYGPKLYRSGNLQNVIDSFKQDGKNTRRAVMSIWTPETDTIDSLNKLGIEKPKDISCNNFLWFWIRDNKLNLKVGIRSNDVLWGLSAINIPEWTFLQEIVLCVLKNEDPQTFGDVELGYYHHSVISMHVYDETATQAFSLVNSEEVNSNNFNTLENFKIILPNVKSHNIQELFQHLYDSFCDKVIGVLDNFSVDDVFEEWNIPKENNQLYCYAKLVESYVEEKVKWYSTETKFDLNILSPDLKQAVINNKFTPKSWL